MGSHPNSQQVWPTIEGQLKGAKYIALLYDVVSKGC